MVRVRLGGNPTFGELLARVRDSVLASYEHQEVPFELVVEAVRPERDPGVNPLFQVNFRVRVGERRHSSWTARRTQPLPVDLGLARFDLALELHVLEDRIDGGVHLRRRAVRPRRPSQRLAGDFEALLRTLVAEPDTRLLV